MKKIKLFNDIEQYLLDLEEMFPSEKEFLKNKVHQYSILMLMMNLISACIDLGTELVTIKQLSYPGTYREVFDILAKNKIISSKLCGKMKDLVGLRNLLAHEYGKVNLELLYEQAENKDVFEEYSQAMIKHFD